MSEYEKAIPFKNWTTEDFLGNYGHETITDEDGNRVIKYGQYEFKPGGTYSVPASQAVLFARQLAVRELHRHGYQGTRPGSTNKIERGEMLSDMDVKEYMDKCFPGAKPGEASPIGTFERIDITDTPAEPSKGVQDANNAPQSAEYDEDDNADDEKNNAGAPKFKKPLGRPRKDAQYV